MDVFKHNKRWLDARRDKYPVRLTRSKNEPKPAKVDRKALGFDFIAAPVDGRNLEWGFKTEANAAAFVKKYG